MSVQKDTGLSLAAAIAPVILTLVVTPFYLHAIGSDRFGILAICWTILSGAALASLGMGPALTYRLALMDGARPAARSNQVWVALFISFAASALIALLLLAVVATYFQHLVSLPSGLKAELWNALPLLAALLPLGTLSGVLNGAVQGRRRFGSLSAMTILNATSIMVAPLAAAVFVSVELPTLVLAMVSANVFVLAIQFALCARIVPLRLPSRLGSEQMNGLLGYGAWMSGMALIAPFLLLYDRFMIGSLRGPTAVAIYVLAFNVLQALLLIPASLNRAMLPRLAPLGTDEEVQALQSSSLRWLNGLLTPLSIVAIAVAAPFLDLWIGSGLAEMAAPAAAILLVGGWVHGIGHVPSTVLIGRSRPDIVAKLLAVYLLPYMLLLYFAALRFGVTGAAAAWTIRAAFDPALFLYTRPRASDLKSVAVSGSFVLAAMSAALVVPWTAPLYWTLMLAILAAAGYQNRGILSSSAGSLQRMALARLGGPPCVS